MTTNQAATDVLELDGRSRIMRAAYPLFVEHGYKTISMQQIADAAQIHKATLYHHFRDKEALFAAVVRIAMGEVHAEVVDVVERGGPVSDQLVQIAAQSFGRVDSDFARLMVDVREAIGAEQRAELLRESSFPWGDLEQIFMRAEQAGELPPVDPQLAVGMYIGLVWGQLWARKVGRVSAPLDEQLARVLVDVLLAGLRHASLPESLLAGGNCNRVQDESF